MGASGASPVARSNQEDPTRVHLAFVVKDLAAARDELEKEKHKILGVPSASGKRFNSDFL